MKHNSLIIFAVALAVFVSASVTSGRGFGGGHGGGLGRDLSNNRAFDDRVDRALSNYDGNYPLYEFVGGGGGSPSDAVHLNHSYNPLAGEQAIASPQDNVNAQRQSFVSSLAGMGIQTGGFRPGQFGPPPTVNHAAADLHVQGNSVRSNFHEYSIFGRDWYSRYPAPGTRADTLKAFGRAPIGPESTAGSA